MNATTKPLAEATAANVLQLSIPKPRRQTVKAALRFKITHFKNASGTVSYRVGGYKRDGTRVRENYDNQASARARQIELETEWLTGEARTEVQATKLSRQQIEFAESAFLRLGPGNEHQMPLAIEHWLRHGR